MADNEENNPAAQANPNPHNLVNELKTIFSNPKADIPLFYGDKAKDSITPRFMYDRILIAQTTYHWSDEATAGNFKLALRGKAIDWLNYIRDTELINVTLWSAIEPHFKIHYDIQIQTVDNVWDFSKLKHEDKDDPADLKLEVSKLINNVASTAPDYLYEIKAQYTFAEVQKITLDATMNLKTHMMKTLFINKLAPIYKDYVLSQEPGSLNEATQTARAMWKRKHPAGVLPVRTQNVTVSPITSDIENSLNNLPDDIREECIAAIKNKRNQYNNRNNSQAQGSYNNRDNSNNQNKRQEKKKGKTSSSSSYDKIKCWFCNKTGHTQIECRSRIGQKKPLTWKNKEIKSKFHSKTILAITDFGDMEEARTWQDRIETEAKQAERQNESPDFQ